ncbi:MAG: 4Fe-4S binding protein [Candidatus Aminicenantes bacterium]|nr:MAG: 4Fe-4S binding protein [Candidatus Aminicenantes bacterium]
MIPIQLKVQPPILLAERFVPGLGWIELLLLSVYAGFIAGKMIDPSKTHKWRIQIWVLFSVVFFSQFIIGLAGFEKFMMTGKLHLPIPAMIVAGPVYRGARFFMPILFGSTVLLTGAAWCSYLCYIGSWDAVAAERMKKSQPMPRWRQPVRIGILAAVVGTAKILRAIGAPSALATGLGISFGVAGVGVILFWSRKKGAMTHCVTYCPIGILANWFGKLSPFRIRIKDACTECQLCRLACRYDALNEDDISKRRPKGTCTLCGDCVTSCKDNLIEYHFLGLKPDQSRTTFVVLVVVLHAVFLGVARI